MVNKFIISLMGLIRLTLIILSFTSIQCLILSVNKISNFPHLLDKKFSIDIFPLLKNETFSKESTDTMIIRIIGKDSSEKQRHEFYYGSQETIDGGFEGKYMDVLLWEKSKTTNKITLSIMFKLISHDMFLELFTFSASNELQRQNILNDLNLATNILRQRIDLFYPIKLNLTIFSLNNTENEIFSGDMVVASCRAYDGFPKHKPIFTIPDQLNVTQTNYDEKIFELKIFFLVSQNNHLNNIICKSGNASENVIIYVLHSPTSIFIEPKIDKQLESNTTIKCFVNDGYPTPEIIWQFINGPVNNTEYFQVAESGSLLYIKQNSFRKSNWKFKCSVKGVSMMMEKLISFTIVDHPTQVYIEPEIQKRLQANSTISCYIKDKILNLEIKWQLIDGPPNASLYYNINKNGSEIYLNTNNSPGTMWSFNCVVKTVITTSKIINKTISFVISDHPTSILLKPKIDKIVEPNTTITCFIKDGMPKQKTFWYFIDGPENALMYYNLQNVSQLLMKENSPIGSRWTFKCSVENYTMMSIKTISFVIMDHPSQLYIKPVIKKRLQSNSLISCYTKDGYLYPKFRWHLIKGPPNPSIYYNVSKKGSEIYMNMNNTPGTLWVFNCTMTSILTKTTKIMNKTISFVIAKSLIKNCDQKCMISLITENEEAIEENSKLKYEIDHMKMLIKQNENLNYNLQYQINDLKNNLQSLTEKTDGQLKNTNENIGIITETLTDRMKSDLFFFRSIFYENSDNYGSEHHWKDNMKLQIKAYIGYSVDIHIRLIKVYSEKLYLTFQCTITPKENYILPNYYKQVSKDMLFNGYDDSNLLASINSGILYSATYGRKLEVECWSFNKRNI